MNKIVTTLAGVLMLAGTSALAQDSGDAAAGEKVFKKCKSCHAVGDGAKNKSGPVLNDLIGRTAGSFESFSKFSKDLKAAGEAGLTWDAASLDGWLTDPSKFLAATLDKSGAKSKMKAKVKKEKDRLNVIAYLAQFSAAAE